MKSDRLDSALVLPYVQTWIYAWYGLKPGDDLSAHTEHPYLTPDDVIREHPEWVRVSESLPVLILADKTGLTPGQLGQWLRRWRQGRPQAIHFFEADALLTAIHQTGLWQQDEELRAERRRIESVWTDAMMDATTERTT